MRADKPIPWTSLKPELRLVFAKRISEKYGPDADPVDWWNERSAASQREWIWHEEHPDQRQGEYDAAVARLEAEVDPATQEDEPMDDARLKEEVRRAEAGFAATVRRLEREERARRGHYDGGGDEDDPVPPSVPPSSARSNSPARHPR